MEDIMQLEENRKKVGYTKSVDQYWAGYDGRLEETWAAIVKLGLQQNVAELEALGYTVLDPQAPADVVERMREWFFDTAERHWGPGARDGSYFDENPRVQTPTMTADIAAEPAFTDAIANDRVLALMRYVLGQNAQYTANVAFYKGRGQRGVLHLDGHLPEPLPAWDTECLAAWLLTDVSSAKDGGLSFVPGSHRFHRQATPADNADAELRAVPVLAPAGSVVIFRGSTWHCALARENPGIRLHVSMIYHRWLSQYTRFSPNLPDGFLAALPEEKREIFVEAEKLHAADKLIREGAVRDNDVKLSEENGEAVRFLEEYERRFRGGTSQYV
jgi:hypothetical protein